MLSRSDYGKVTREKVGGGRAIQGTKLDNGESVQNQGKVEGFKEDKNANDFLK